MQVMLKSVPEYILGLQESAIGVCVSLFHFIALCIDLQLKKKYCKVGPIQRVLHVHYLYFMPQGFSSFENFSLMIM